MKMIFESEQEKENFINRIANFECPEALGSQRCVSTCEESLTCRECWRKAIEESWEVKDENQK